MKSLLFIVALLELTFTHALYNERSFDAVQQPLLPGTSGKTHHRVAIIGA
jgi:hypothetical protein